MTSVRSPLLAGACSLPLAAQADPVANLRPRHPSYGRLRDALGRYRAIDRAGGWPAIPERETLRLGGRAPRVLALRPRLAVTGDLATSSAVDEFDEPLEAAVRSFQSRHGLDPDGVVGAQTRAALNVPVAKRIEQLEINLYGCDAAVIRALRQAADR